MLDNSGPSFLSCTPTSTLDKMLGPRFKPTGKHMTPHKLHPLQDAKQSLNWPDKKTLPVLLARDFNRSLSDVGWFAREHLLAAGQ